MKCLKSIKLRVFPGNTFGFSVITLNTLLYVIFFITKASKDDREVITDIDMEAVKVSTGCNQYHNQINYSAKFFNGLFSDEIGLVFFKFFLFKSIYNIECRRITIDKNTCMIYICKKKPCIQENNYIPYTTLPVLTRRRLI